MKVQVVVKPPKKWYGKETYLLTKEIQVKGVVIPVGFESDGASIPTWLSPVGLGILALNYFSLDWLLLHFIGCLIALVPFFFPRANKYLVPAFAHDYALSLQSMTRAKADLLFLQSLEVTGVSRIRRWLMYFAVRLLSIIRRGRKN